MFAGRVALRATTLAVVALAAVVCLLLLRHATAPAEANGTMSAGQETANGTNVQVRVEALSTERDGITGKPRTSRTDFQPIGTTVTRYLTAGSGRDPNVCKASFSDSGNADSVIIWKLDTKVVGASPGRPQLQVHWTRTRTGNPVAERDETRTITLGPGDTHILDFVESPAPADTSCASVLVRIGADAILPRPSRPIMVDLWTVDENAPGGARSVHQRVHGLSDDSLTYELPPLGIEPVSSASTRGHTVKLQVGGRLQAVLLPDGFVDVTLNAVRRTVSGKATVQGEGRVQFRSKVGETAAVLLPEPAWRLPLLEGDGAVDLRQLFAGHKLSLYVRVEPAQ